LGLRAADGETGKSGGEAGHRRERCSGDLRPSWVHSISPRHYSRFAPCIEYNIIAEDLFAVYDGASSGQGVETLCGNPEISV
jgi:hypothetical protein